MAPPPVVSVHLQFVADLRLDQLAHHSRGVECTASYSLSVDVWGAGSELRLLLWDAAVIAAVRVDGVAAHYTQSGGSSKVLALAEASVAEEGLEPVTAALTASLIAPPELLISLPLAAVPPAGAGARAPLTRRLEVDYTLSESQVRFATTGADQPPYCLALPPRDPSSSLLALFPTLDDPDARYIGGVTVTLLAPAHQSPALVVECSGRPSPAAALIGEAVHYPLLAGPDATVPRTHWSFSIVTPVPPSAIGWVAGPLRYFSRGGSSGAGRGGAAAAAEILAFACEEGKCTPHAMGLHVRRSRRVLQWLTDYLDLPLPQGRQAHVYLPPSLFPATAALAAAPTGLGIPSNGSSSLLFCEAAVRSGTVYLSGLALYSDELLTGSAVVDPAATSLRAQAEAAAGSWFGCGSLASGPCDAWISVGIAGHLAGLALRGIRGDAEHRIDLARGAETVARLEEQAPQLHALCPTGAAATDPVLLGLHPLRERYVAAKAALVFHMLGVSMGEEAMQRLLRFVARRACSPAPLTQEEVQALLGVGGAAPAGAPAAAPPAAAAADTQSSAAPAAAAAPASDAAPSPAPPLDGLGTGPLFTTTQLRDTVTQLSGAASRPAVSQFFSQWVHDTGVPHLLAGIHVNRKRNCVEVVVEQLVRPGSRLFSGPLTVHIAERPDSGEAGGAAGSSSSSAATALSHIPDVWEHVVHISALREAFQLPCHTKVAKRPKLGGGGASQGADAAAAALLPDTHRKKLRRKDHSSAGGERLEAAEGVSSSSSSRVKLRGSDAGGGEEAGGESSPVVWVRIDPRGEWALRRLLVVAAPSLLLGQLLGEGDPFARIEAANSLGASGSRDAVYTPGSNDRDLWPVEAFPYVERVHPLDDPEVGQVILNSGAAGASSRAATLAALAAIVLDRDPTTRTVASLALSGDGAGELLLPDGSRLQGCYAPPPAAAARRKELGGGSSAHATAPPPASQVLGAAPPGAVGVNFRLRCAAAAALARWASGHLPPLRPAEGQEGKASPASTHLGLRVLLAVYKAAYFLPERGPAAVSSAAGAAAASGEPAPLPLISALGLPSPLQTSLAEREASTGTPGPIAVSSFGELCVQRSLLYAISGVRTPDGATPPAVLLFMTRLLRAYDADACDGVFDDSATHAALVLGTAQAALDGVGTLPQSALLASLATIRETLAVRLAELPAGGAAGAGAEGTVAAACITALSLLESRGVLDDTPALPLLRHFLGREHKLLGGATLALPPRIRLAAFVGLVRGYLIGDPLRDASVPLLRKRAHDEAWLARCAELVGFAATLASAPGGDLAERALGCEMLAALYQLQLRTDSDAPEQATLGDSPPEEERGHPAWLLARLEGELRSSFVPAQLALHKSLQQQLEQHQGDGAPPLEEDAAPAGSPTWLIGHALLDFGFQDRTQDAGSRCSVAERRLYGMRRLSPSSRGFLGRLADHCLQPQRQEGEEGGAEGVVGDTGAYRALPASLGAALRGAAHSRLPSLFPTVVGLWHGVWGLLQPTPPRSAGSASAAAASSPAGSPARAALADVLAVLTDQRRVSIAAAHAEARRRHLSYRAMLAEAAAAKEEATAFLGEEGALGGGGDGGAGEAQPEAADDDVQVVG